MSTLYERLEEQIDELNDCDLMVLNNEICERELSKRFIFDVDDIYEYLDEWFDGDITKIVNALGHGTFNIGHSFMMLNEVDHIVSSNDIWELTYFDKEETINYLMCHPDFAEYMFFTIEE